MHVCGEDELLWFTALPNIQMQVFDIRILHEGILEHLSHLYSIPHINIMLVIQPSSSQSTQSKNIANSAKSHSADMQFVTNVGPL